MIRELLAHVLEIPKNYPSTILSSPPRINLFSSMTELYEYRLRYHHQVKNAHRILSSKDPFVTFRSALCTDTRDRIYGLLGLIESQELETYPTRPDYSKPSSALFINLWKCRYKSGPTKFSTRENTEKVLPQNFIHLAGYV